MTSKRDDASGPSTVVLLPIMAAIVGVYLVIGLAMPVLPLQVHQGLGFGPFVVGVVSGSQFAAAMFSRLWAGRQVDKKDAKHALISGLLLSAISGLLYVLSFGLIVRGNRWDRQHAICGHAAASGCGLLAVPVPGFG